jgi:hypothetical protein
LGSGPARAPTVQGVSSNFEEQDLEVNRPTRFGHGFKLQLGPWAKRFQGASCELGVRWGIEVSLDLKARTLALNGDFFRPSGLANPALGLGLHSVDQRLGGGG